LLAVLATRMALGLGVAFAGRWALAEGQVVDATDAVALGAAVVVSLACAAAARGAMPRAWAWREARVAPVVAAWAERHAGIVWVDGPCASGAPRGEAEAERADLVALDALLTQFASVEVASGVSQAAARRAAVESAAAAWTERRAVRLARVRDALPLVELVGIGVPGLLMLLVPAVRMLG
jgi:hypothetical protein